MWRIYTVDEPNMTLCAFSLPEGGWMLISKHTIGSTKDTSGKSIYVMPQKESMLTSGAYIYECDNLLNVKLLGKSTTLTGF